MASALSIADAVDRMNCGFTGCERCPYRVYAREDHACILPDGVNALLALPFLARLLGQDEARARALVDIADNELERAIDLQGHEYSVASIDETKV